MSCDRRCYDKNDAFFGRDDCENCPGQDNGHFAHKVVPDAGVRSNDLIGDREHLASEKPLSQGVESEASTRAIGADSELLLLPCPFCGGKAQFGVADGEFEGGEFIECTHCRATTSLRFPDKTSVKEILRDDWNRRV